VLDPAGGTDISRFFACDVSLKSVEVRIFSMAFCVSRL
jgi:hypothetical protein